MQHILTRETAYARLIVAIVLDDTVRGRNRTAAIDALVQRFIDTTPADQVCHSHVYEFSYCEACASTDDWRTVTEIALDRRNRASIAGARRPVSADCHCPDVCGDPNGLTVCEPCYAVLA